MTKPAPGVRTACVFEIRLNASTGSGPPSMEVRDSLWNEMPAATPAERSRKAVTRWRASYDANSLIEILRSGEADPGAQELAAELIEQALTGKLPGTGNREQRRLQILSTFVLAEHLGHGTMAAMEIAARSSRLTSWKSVDALRHRYPELVQQLRASFVRPDSYTPET